jgi:TPR repeat protein
MIAHKPIIGITCVCLLCTGPLGRTQSLANNPPNSAGTQSSQASQLLIRAHAYLRGTNGPPDFVRAFQLFQQASQQGSLEANAWLGIMYVRGQGTLQNLVQGAGLIQAAAAADNPIGLRFLGVIYQNGLGVPQNYIQAKSYYEKAIALSDANSSGRLALMYLSGLGVQLDTDRAIRLLEQGAAGGDDFSQLSLGRFYAKSSHGSDPGNRDSSLLPVHSSSENYALAVKYYGQAVQVGNRSAAFYLGQMYEQGLGVKQDYSQAFTYYQQSASRGLPEAQVALGQLYELGLGASVNYVNAYTYYGLAESQGSSTAAQHLKTLSQLMTSGQRQEAESIMAQVHEQRVSERQLSSDSESNK